MVEILMRQVADVPGEADEVCSVMIYDAGDAGVYLFLYRTPGEGPCHADHWFESLAAAVESAEAEHGISPGDWQTFPDPLPGCQHDWVAPVRVKRDAGGRSVWGEFEPLGGGPDSA